MNTVNVIEQYLLGKDFSAENFDKKSTGCFKNVIEGIFDCTIDCDMYDQVVNGEGNEKDKISSVYSSSLQSLLFFSQVSESNPLVIGLNEKESEKIEFTEVHFEYKNKVIGYPSSIDVVLVDKAKKNILFIESKLAEIARDSCKLKEGVERSKVGTKEVGISYLSDDTNGYYNALGLLRIVDANPKLCNDDLAEIGIEAVYADSYPMSQTFIRGKSKEKSRIYPIDGNEYVYSYGIKQMLAHIIGIINYRNDCVGDNCSGYLRSIHSSANVYFMELFNELPNINKYEITKAQEDYVKHVNKVFDVIKNRKVKDIKCMITSYQKLFSDSDEYKISQKIVDFYHLDGKNN